MAGPDPARVTTEVDFPGAGGLGEDGSGARIASGGGFHPPRKDLSIVRPHTRTDGQPPSTFFGARPAGEDVPTLPYGSSSTLGGRTCTSATDGVTCTDARGVGFRLARESLTLLPQGTAPSATAASNVTSGSPGPTGGDAGGKGKGKGKG